MHDLISRQAAIDALESKAYRHTYLDQIVGIIEDLPSAQPKGYTDQLRWERDTAIQQLKELGYGLGEKPRTDGDTISRQAAIDAALEAADDWDGGCNKSRDKYITSALIELPSAQPERKAGKWIKEPYLNDTWIIRCSNCMRLGMIGSGKGFNYCPHCGADMRGKT